MAKATLTIDIDAGAMEEFVDAWSDGMLHVHIGELLTCSETEALAGVLRAAGRPAAADGLIDAHSYGDEEGDLHYGG